MSNTAVFSMGIREDSGVQITGLRDNKPVMAISAPEKLFIFWHLRASLTPP
jgi:hypothetical protein